MGLAIALSDRALMAWLLSLPSSASPLFLAWALLSKDFHVLLNFMSASAS